MTDAALTDGQREAIEKIILASQKSGGLSAAQRWEAGVVFAAMLGGTLAIFGTAGYFLIVNAAKEATAIVAPQQVAAVLVTNTDFVSIVQGAAGLGATGVVVPFDRAEGCPLGWTEYVTARGRTIVGAGLGGGLSERGFQEQGGEERVALAVANIPPHSHNAEAQLSGTAMRFNDPSGAIAGRFGSGEHPFSQEAHVHPVRVSETGGGVPHNNMPPFVALYYCRKD